MAAGLSATSPQGALAPCPTAWPATALLAALYVIMFGIKSFSRITSRSPQRLVGLLGHFTCADGCAVPDPIGPTDCCLSLACVDCCIVGDHAGFQPIAACPLGAPRLCQAAPSRMHGLEHCNRLCGFQAFFQHDPRSSMALSGRLPISHALIAAL